MENDASVVHDGHILHDHHNAKQGKIYHNHPDGHIPHTHHVNDLKQPHKHSGKPINSDETWDWDT